MVELTDIVDMAEKSATSEVARLGRRVDKLLEERKLTEKWLYTSCGMSKQGWSDMWKTGSIKLRVVHMIAMAFKMDVSELLNMSKEPTQLHEPAATYQARPRYLEERVADLERELHELKKTLHRK